MENSVDPDETANDKKTQTKQQQQKKQKQKQKTTQKQWYAGLNVLKSLGKQCNINDGI